MSVNRDHDSEKDLLPGYAVLWNEIERLKQGESELKQELAHLKQQQMGVVVATTKVSAAEAAEIVISDGVAGVMPAAEAAEDEDEEVELEESTWVFPLLVGDLVGAATSTYLLVLTLVTAVIQALFLDLLRSKDSGMIEPLTAEDVDSLSQWRRTVAHDYKYYTELEEATLAKRVCGGGLSSENSKRARSAIELAASQAGLYEDLSGYLGKDGDGMGKSGQIMCILALLVWIVTMLQELFACYRTIAAVVQVPRGRSTVMSEDGENDNALTITAISLPQAALCLIAQLGRATIGCLLLFWGIQFLVYTPNIGDLLLNAVALEFVISVDELVFAALAPYKIRALVGAAATLHMPSPPRWAQCWGVRLDLRAIFRAGATAALLAFAIVHELNPQIRLMVQARDALCAGDLDFVYTKDGLGAVAWAYPPSVLTSSTNARNFPEGNRPEVEYTADEPRLTFAESVIEVLLRQQGRDAMQDDPRNDLAGCAEDVCMSCSAEGGVSCVEREDRPDCCLAVKVRVPTVTASRFSIAIKAAETTEDAVALWNPSCSDVLGGGAGYDPLLQGAMGDAIEEAACGDGCPAKTPICLDGVCVQATCPDVARYCHANSVAGVRARQLCPITCGCASPRAPLALALPSSGCGTRCVHAGRYLAARAQLPCADVDTSDSDFVALLDDWEAAASTWPNDWKWGSSSWIAGLRQYGCAYLGDPAAMTEAVTTPGDTAIFPPYLFGINPCIEGGTFFPTKPLSYFCPVACGCHSGDPHCPDACPMRTAATPMCPAAQLTAIADPTNGDCPMTDHRNYGAYTRVNASA